MSLYLVTDAEAKKDAKPRFIKAQSAAQAVRHVTGTRFNAEVVSNAEKTANLFKAGYVLETAGEDVPPPADPSADGETKAEG